MSLKYDFSGKSILLTGGSKGIGFKLLETLAECGAKVISLSRTINTIHDLMNLKPSLSIYPIICDVSKTDELNIVLKSLPHIDCLVNNSAIGNLTKFGEITDEEIDVTFNLNVKAIIKISQVISNRWKNEGIEGIIVNVSSQASQRAINNHTVYCASKAAVDALTRSMALELGPYNIRVNSVNPTAILTDLGRLYWEDKSRSENLISRLPLKRLGQVEEVVHVIMYLLSDHCTLITGAAIPVDAGFLCC